MIVTVDKYTRVVLTALTVLLTIVAVGLWCDGPSSLETAEAKLPDSGLQFNLMIEELSQVNATIADLKQLLVSGAVRVQVVNAPTGDKPSGAGIVSQIVVEPAADAMTALPTSADTAATEPAAAMDASAPASQGSDGAQ